MKIEKLTENKIRIIVKPSDLKVKNLDLHLMMDKTFEGQNFFADMLEQAKKEVGFNTDGCKLLIESFTSDDLLIFTITKYSFQEIKNNKGVSKNKLIVKRKTFNTSKKQALYQFKTFDEFCNFCECLSKNIDFDIKKLSKNISLYLYHNTYYLLVKNIDTSYKRVKTFYYIANEFSSPLAFSLAFENKLIEHGKVIMKKNAITTGIKYFVAK